MPRWSACCATSSTFCIRSFAIFRRFVLSYTYLIYERPENRTSRQCDTRNRQPLLSGYGVTHVTDDKGAEHWLWPNCMKMPNTCMRSFVKARKGSNLHNAHIHNLSSDACKPRGIRFAVCRTSNRDATMIPGLLSLSNVMSEYSWSLRKNHRININILF